MSTRRTRWGCLVAGSSVVLLACGCPPLAPTDSHPACTEAELTRNLSYEQSILAADADQVIIERLGYPSSSCTVPNGFVGRSPVERVWVRVRLADLALTTVLPPLVNPAGTATDGQWAAAAGQEDGTIFVRNLDTGESSTVASTTGYQYVADLDWPYLLVQDENGYAVHDFQSGARRRVPGEVNLGEAELSNGFLFYVEHVAGVFPWDPPGDRLKLWDITADTETVVAEERADIRQLWVLSTRAVWSEYDADSDRESIFVYERLSGAVSPLVQDDGVSEWPWVDDVGDPGILVDRWEIQPGDLRMVDLDMVSWDGQRKPIDGYSEVRDQYYGRARFAGPYVVYARGGGWVVYDTRDGSSRSIQPFEGM